VTNRQKNRSCQPLVCACSRGPPCTSTSHSFSHLSSTKRTLRARKQSSAMRATASQTRVTVTRSSRTSVGSWNTHLAGVGLLLPRNRKKAQVDGWDKAASAQRSSLGQESASRVYRHAEPGLQDWCGGCAIHSGEKMWAAVVLPWVVQTLRLWCRELTDGTAFSAMHSDSVLQV